MLYDLQAGRTKKRTTPCLVRLSYLNHSGIVLRMPKPLARFLVIYSCVGAVMAGPSSEIAGAIHVIKAVGPEGRGNVEAAAAWKQLAASDAATLLTILEAMDGANDFALNWLRAAVDAIFSRELAAGGKVPVSDLGKFLMETRHHPRARRLVFELLTRLDPPASEKLLSGMLNDPSLEIRYDAAQKVAEQAEQLLATSNRVGAMLLFQQALNYSRDAKQINAVAKKLEELGQTVDLLKQLGFLTQWKIIGPFDNTGRKGFETMYPPEQKIDFAADYPGKSGQVGWKDYVVTHKYGKVDMNQAYGKLKEVTAYATTEFVSERAQPVELRFGGKNSWKVWLNGKLLFGRDEYHFDSEIDQYSMPAELRAGHNTILVKVCQNEQTEDWTVEWDFQLRVTDSLGTPITPANR
jgi:hypothetical protein